MSIELPPDPVPPSSMLLPSPVASSFLVSHPSSPPPAASHSHLTHTHNNNIIYTIRPLCHPVNSSITSPVSSTVTDSSIHPFPPHAHAHVHGPAPPCPAPSSSQPHLPPVLALHPHAHPVLTTINQTQHAHSSTYHFPSVHDHSRASAPRPTTTPGRPHIFIAHSQPLNSSTALPVLNQHPNTKQVIVLDTKRTAHIRHSSSIDVPSKTVKSSKSPYARPSVSPRRKSMRSPSKSPLTSPRQSQNNTKITFELVQPINNNNSNSHTIIISPVPVPSPPSQAPSQSQAEAQPHFDDLSMKKEVEEEKVQEEHMIDDHAHDDDTAQSHSPAHSSVHHPSDSLLDSSSDVEFVDSPSLASVDPSSPLLLASHSAKHIQHKLINLSLADNQHTNQQAQQDIQSHPLENEQYITFTPRASLQSSQIQPPLLSSYPPSPPLSASASFIQPAPPPNIAPAPPTKSKRSKSSKRRARDRRIRKAYATVTLPGIAVAPTSNSGSSTRRSSTSHFRDHSLHYGMSVDAVASLQGAGLVTYLAEPRASTARSAALHSGLTSRRDSTVAEQHDPFTFTALVESQTTPLRIIRTSRAQTARSSQGGELIPSPPAEPHILPAPSDDESRPPSSAARRLSFVVTTETGEEVSGLPTNQHHEEKEHDADSSPSATPEISSSAKSSPKQSPRTSPARSPAGKSSQLTSPRTRNTRLKLRKSSVGSSDDDASKSAASSAAVSVANSPVPSTQPSPAPSPSPSRRQSGDATYPLPKEPPSHRSSQDERTLAEKQAEKERKEQIARQLEERRAEFERKKFEREHKKKYLEEMAKLKEEEKRIAREKMTKMLAEQHQMRKKWKEENDAREAQERQLEEEQLRKERAQFLKQKSQNVINKLMTPTFASTVKSNPLKAEEVLQRKRIEDDLNPSLDIVDHSNPASKRNSGNQSSSPQLTATPNTADPSVLIISNNKLGIGDRLNTVAADAKSRVSSRSPSPQPDGKKKDKQRSGTATGTISDKMLKACKKGDLDAIKKCYAEELSAKPRSSFSQQEFKQDFFNRLDKNGSTAIFHAVWAGHYDCVAYMLEQGANVNHQNLKLHSCLHLCVERCWDTITLLLLRYGADPTLINHEKKTCYQVFATSKAAMEAASLIYTYLESILKASPPSSISPHQSPQPAAVDESDAIAEEKQEAVDAHPGKLNIEGTLYDCASAVQLHANFQQWMSELSSFFMKKNDLVQHAKHMTSKIQSVMRMGMLKLNKFKSNNLTGSPQSSDGTRTPQPGLPPLPLRSQNSLFNRLGVQRNMSRSVGASLASSAISSQVNSTNASRRNSGELKTIVLPNGVVEEVTFTNTQNVELHCESSASDSQATSYQNSPAPLMMNIRIESVDDINKNPLVI